MCVHQKRKIFPLEVFQQTCLCTQTGHKATPHCKASWESKYLASLASVVETSFASLKEKEEDDFWVSKVYICAKLELHAVNTYYKTNSFAGE